jgi:iron complex outermembrane receptor protein
LLNASAGTDILVNKRKVAELYLIGENLTNRAYLSHLSRLKYLGDRGVSNMGRNITMKLVIPITL